MSSILPTTGTGVAPVDQAKLPADVRAAGPKAEQLYETALSFEQVLLNQLTEQLQATATAVDGSGGDGSGDDGSSNGGDASSGLLTQMIPQAFSQGLTSAGGIGIARQLYDSMKAQAGISSPPVENQ